jgi:hypothetical protein
MARHDYQPFGEEIQRTAYGSDSIRQGFVRDKTGEKYDNLSFWQSDSKVIGENNDRAVRLENVERRRLGMPLRYQHH